MQQSGQGRHRNAKFLGQKQQADDYMTYDDDRQIGWSVIRPVMVQFLAAAGAVIVDLEIGPENLAFAAGRAAAAKALADGGPNFPALLRAGNRLSGP
jgi:hypothetical protein